MIKVYDTSLFSETLKIPKSIRRSRFSKNSCVRDVQKSTKTAETLYAKDAKVWCVQDV